MNDIKPLPKINADNAVFWQGCKNRELMFQKCLDCHHLRHPASGICPNCLSGDAEWTISSGQGTVYTYAVYHAVYHPGFSDDLPYVTAIVALDEGPHMLTNIVECPPEKVAIGMKVTVVWDEVAQGIVLPKFKPALMSE